MLPHTEGGAGGALECLPRQCDPNGLKVLLALQGGRNDCFFGRNIKHRNRNNFKQTLKEVERRNNFVLEIMFI